MSSLLAHALSFAAGVLTTLAALGIVRAPMRARVDALEARVDELLRRLDGG